MKTFLFIIALAFNIALCSYPFEEQSKNTEPLEKSIRVNPDLIKCKPEPKGLAYSDMLKNKASQLQRH